MTQPAAQATWRKHPSTTVATMSNDVLLEQVRQDKLRRRERAEQLATLEELTQDHHTLRTAILSYQKQRHLATNILERTVEAVHTMRAVLELHAEKAKKIGRAHV